MFSSSVLLQYTYVDSDDKRLVTVNFDTGPGVGGMWKKGRFDERYPGMQNPWKGRGGSAPYDQRFYIVMNVAVGGVNGFFPDGAVSEGTNRTLEFYVVSARCSGNSSNINKRISSVLKLYCLQASTRNVPRGTPASACVRRVLRAVSALVHSFCEARREERYKNVCHHDLLCLAFFVPVCVYLYLAF